MAINKIFLDGKVHSEPHRSSLCPNFLELIVDRGYGEFGKGHGEFFRVLVFPNLVNILKPKVGERILVIGLLNSWDSSGDPQREEHSPVLILARHLFKIEVATWDFPAGFDPHKDRAKPPCEEREKETFFF